MTKSLYEIDASLFKQINDGSRSAYESLFLKYYKGLGAFAYRYVQDIGISEDLVQDVFLKLWSGRQKLNINLSVKSYLYNSVKNACLNYLKREEIKTSVFAEKIRELENINYQYEYELEELKMFLNDCIGDLPPRCQLVFKESRFKGKKQIEISQKLNISINTVKVQISKALAYLYDCLDEKYYTPQKKIL